MTQLASSKLSSPPARDPTNPESATATHVSESHHLVRERAFPSSSDLNYVLRLLRSSHSTGTLMIDVNQGGVGSIRFREETKVDFT